MPSSYAFHRNTVPPIDDAIAFCDLSHKFHKKVTSVFLLVAVNPLCGILMSPQIVLFEYTNIRGDVKIQ